MMWYLQTFHIKLKSIPSSLYKQTTNIRTERRMAKQTILLTKEKYDVWDYIAHLLFHQHSFFTSFMFNNKRWNNLFLEKSQLGTKSSHLSHISVSHYLSYQLSKEVVFTSANILKARYVDKRYEIPDIPMMHDWK